jgi:hypothetical protein
MRPAAEKRQATKSREVGHRQRRERYEEKTQQWQFQTSMPDAINYAALSVIAPWPASASAAICPIPDVAPVMTTTFPSTTRPPSGPHYLAAKRARPRGRGER